MPHRQLSIPYPASSLFFAIRSAPKAQRPALRALYTLHKKWREAAVYQDQHQAVTTLNWWHHELDKALEGEVNHPALLILRPWLSDAAFFKALQGLLHGHMHWHHITRIDTLAQLEPTIEAIGGSFAQCWTHINGCPAHSAYAQAAGQAIWWIDQTRHIGHSLTPSRLWLPMAWLKELNLPAHLILKRDAAPEIRAEQLQTLIQRLQENSQTALTSAQALFDELPKSERKKLKSLQLLLQLRALLLAEIGTAPAELWRGLVTVGPRRKWWASL